MSKLKRLFIKTLDRSGGRGVLSTAASFQAKCDVFWDDVWCHRIDGNVYADSLRFDYYASSPNRWRREHQSLEEEVSDLWYSHYIPKEGDIVVDVGAGKGEHVIPISRRIGEAGKLIAIEAHPECITCLRTAVRLNQLRNVTALHAAVSDSCGSLTIETDATDWTRNTISSDGGTTGFRVEALTIDSLFESKSLDQIDFLKMNIEGAETMALAGLDRHAKRVKHLCVCCHDFRYERGEGEFYRTREKVIQLLQERGFSTEARQDPRPSVRDQVLAWRAD